MNNALFGEFMGTLVLILLGNGVVANVLLNKSKGENGGWIVITTGWALAVMCGIFTATACGSADAHLNPGGDFRSGGIDRRLQQVRFPTSRCRCWARSRGRRWCGCITFRTGARRRIPDRKLACFSTGPAIRSFGPNLMSEIIGTFVLVLVGNAIFAKKVVPGGVGSGTRPVPGGKPGLGHRIESRRDHRVRHQSRARPGAAHRACDPAGGEEGRAPIGAMRPCRRRAR